MLSDRKLENGDRVIIKTPPDNPNASLTVLGPGAALRVRLTHADMCSLAADMLLGAQEILDHSNDMHVVQKGSALCN